MLFFNVFLRTLGFLSALLVMIIIVNILLHSTNDIEKSKFIITEGNKNSPNSIALINLNGPIFDNNNNIFGNNFYNYINPETIKSYLEELKELKIKTLIININSPGGTVSATAEVESIFYDYKKETNAKIYFFTKEILASGGYWVATSADKIFASYGAVIGSIGVSGPSWFYYNTPTSISNGVFGQSIETKNGIEVYSQNAGAGKDLFNPYRKPKKEELIHLQNIVDEIYNDFLQKVSKSRNVEISFIKNNVSSLVYSSKQAKDNFLIDEVLDYNELIKYIAKENNFNDYKIYENQKNISLIDNILTSYKKNNSIHFYNKVCRKFKTNISLINPLFLNEC